MSKFTSRAAARKDAQKQGKSIGEIEISYNEKAKSYTWKLAEVKPVTCTPEPAKSADAEKGNGKPAKKAHRIHRAKFQPEQIITVLVDKNPKRKGSKSHPVFALYKTGQTVTQYLEIGGHQRDLRWDVDHKFIAID